MSTTPRVEVPEGAFDDDGVITMGEVIAEHAPVLAAARRRYFDTLLTLTAAEPVAHELLRLATAELTGCRLCRNQRSAAAAEAGVDETVIASARQRRYDALDERARTALELGDRIRAHPGDMAGADDPEPAPEVTSLGVEAATAMIMTTTRALADGKALVALGLEPADYPVQVPA
jgi:alkylhydroperoxidase family enzyme